MRLERESPAGGAPVRPWPGRWPKLWVMALAVAAAASWAPALAGHGQACQAERIVDGDTFVWAGQTVRVAGFDAPERAQPRGRDASAHLGRILASGASCDCYKADQYGRAVCTVRTASGLNVATAMLAAGLGCIDPRFEAEASAQDRQAARQALRQAQTQAIGIWADSDPICGFDYRRQQRERGVAQTR